MEDKLYSLDGLHMTHASLVKAIGTDPDDLVGRSYEGRVYAHGYVRGWAVPLDAINAAYGLRKNTLKHRLRRGMSLADAARLNTMGE